MRQKKLQDKSKYAQYDIDNDGIVSDEEFEHMAEIKRLEHDLRKQRAQRRMATASLVAMSVLLLVRCFLLISIELKLWRILVTFSILLGVVLCNDCLHGCICYYE